MAEIQFEVITDLTVMNPQHIETNFDEVRDWLAKVTEPYTKMVVTEDAISDAKKNLAALRKVKDQIEVQRKAVKKEWMKPYEEFERDKAKVLTGILDEAIANIDGQVKDYDSRRKEQKMENLEDFYDQEATRYRVADYLSWDSIKNPKWANATFSEEDAQNAISEIILETARDVDYITGSGSPHVTAMLEEYRKSHSLRSALDLETRLKAIQEAEERKKAERVADTFREEEAADAQDANLAAPEPQAPQFIRPIEEDEPPKPKLYDLAFKVKVTMQQAHALKAFFSEQGIEYHKI